VQAKKSKLKVFVIFLSDGEDYGDTAALLKLTENIAKK